MNAQPRRISPPSPQVTVTVEHDVDIDPEDLEDQGWIYIGEDDLSPSSVFDIVRRWHDDTHPAAWQFCDQEPCRSLR